MVETSDVPVGEDDKRGSSPAARGGAGSYIEGELGAFYLLAMLAGVEPRGMPGVRLHAVRFQGQEQGFALDDLVLEGNSTDEACTLEIQSKRTITFAPMDPVFREVCEQIGTSLAGGVNLNRHMMAVATERTSRAISGPYQDVLLWARRTTSAAEFFTRINAKGIGSPPMREFVQTFRANLVKAGVADEDTAIWQILRSFLILEFDFESVAPLARDHAVLLSRQVLADDEVSKAGALHTSLIELSLATAKTGGSINRQSLIGELVGRGFKLRGDRSLNLARARLAELAQQTLADIGNSVAGVTLARESSVARVDAAMDKSRFVEIRGESGVGKSWVLRHIAERHARESHIIVLDPLSTPENGWGGFAQSIGAASTAQDFLADLAVSGGGILFVDSLEMFTDPKQQRTVNDLLRTVASIGGFSVVATARPDFGKEGDSWLASDALVHFGHAETVVIGALTEDEVELLREQAPELKALLAPSHPAAAMARNLYRLSRLLKVPDAAELRTEAALAHSWWTTADGAPGTELRAAQRLMAELADQSLQGEGTLAVQIDSAARTHLLRTLTLREVKRDVLAFYHDVLRDWAVACRIAEDASILAGLDLTLPVSARVARGVELAGRLMLELGDVDQWLAFLAMLSGPGAHGSWRRQVLLAIVRSERGSDLLNTHASALLADGALLFKELVTTIIATDTVATADVVKRLDGPLAQMEIPKTLRTNLSGSATKLLIWSVGHVADFPLMAIPSVLDLIQAQVLVLNAFPNLTNHIAKMLFGWLTQIDVQGAAWKFPAEPDSRFDRSAIEDLKTELRMWALMYSGSAPEDARSYLRAVTPERDHFKVKAIRPFSKALAPVAARELADLIVASLIDHEEDRSHRRRSQLGREFDFGDNDYLPASPAQAPFLDLLEAVPAVGLQLIRHLTSEAVRLHTDGADPGTDGFTLVFPSGARFFPWVNTYLWSRDQCREYSVGSGLKALEAWGHIRLDRGDKIDDVITDVLGPEGSCAAFLLVAVDLLISHVGVAREALVPFVANPELLAWERMRQVRDPMLGAGLGIGDEPTGRVRLKDLAERPSRQVALERALGLYVSEDLVSERARNLLESAVAQLGPYAEDATFRDPEFMGQYALNVLNRNNWVDHGNGPVYQSPVDEAAHLARLQPQSSALNTEMDIDASVQLATRDRTRGSSELARKAAEYASGALPYDEAAEGWDMKSKRLVATAMLVARDGDDATLQAYEVWIRATIDRVLSKPAPPSDFQTRLEFSEPALAASALIHLWRRQLKPDDRNRLLDLTLRNDRSSVLAFADNLEVVLAADGRVLKSACRIAFATYRYRWAPWDEDAEVKANYERDKSVVDNQAVATEVAWLDGGVEPEWPSLPAERPLRRHRPGRIPVAVEDDEDNDEYRVDAKDKSSVHAQTQSLASWLNLLAQKACADQTWRREIVHVYSHWSAELNGLNLPADVELDGRHDDWNNVFYLLLSLQLMDMPQDDFQPELDRILALPDQSFCDVIEPLLQAADATYFNDSPRSPDRIVALRDAIIRRAMAIEDFDWGHAKWDMSVGMGESSALSKLLLNTHDFVNGLSSYLVPAVAHKIDPLFPSMALLMSGGPTSFLARSTMNTLLVAPLPRHMEFLLSSAEAWLDRTGKDPRMWLELGVGAKVTEWFEKVSVDDSGIFAPTHPDRARMDALFSRLVDLGVPEAHELVLKVESEADGS